MESDPHPVAYMHACLLLLYIIETNKSKAYLIIRVEQCQHITALHGDLARRLLRVVVEGDHTLLARYIHYWGLLLLFDDKDNEQFTYVYF